MTKLPANDQFVLVCTIGGSPQPLIQSIKFYQPQYAILIPSITTQDSVNEILKESGGIPNFAIIALSDHQDFVSCVREIRSEIPVCLRKWRLSPETLLIADFTGGTKVMSASLAMAVMEFNSRFSYVGGKNEGGLERDKEGRGIVKDGFETIIYLDNPWKVMGLFEARDLAQAFNNANFDVARNKAEFLKTNDEDFTKFYDGLANVIQAYDLWNKFNYRDAAKIFTIALGKLKDYNNRSKANFQPLFKLLEKDKERLEVLAKDMDKLQGKFESLAAHEGDAYLRDLAANALRLGEQGQYDDAVARLYSAVEKSAKIALAKKGINNSDVQRSQLAEMGPELIDKYLKTPDDQKIQMPLRDSFLALAALEPEHPLFLAYKRHEEDLHNSLESRNMSLLAHGYNPVDKKAYEKLRNIVFSFLELQAEELPSFPKLQPEQILF